MDLLDLGQPADATTQAYVAQLVAGVVRNVGWASEPVIFDGSFPVGYVSDVPIGLSHAESEELTHAALIMEQTLEELARQLGERVTCALSDVLLEPLVAELYIAPAVARVVSPTLEWRFHRPNAERTKVGFDGLSSAERQWAERAVNEAVYWHRREHDAKASASMRPALYLLDEPEAALHRAAEAYMARSLLDRVADPRKVVMVAAHSPELLDTNGVCPEFG